MLFESRRRCDNAASFLGALEFASRGTFEGMTGITIHILNILGYHFAVQYQYSIRTVDDNQLN